MAQKIPVIDSLVAMIPKQWIPEWMPEWGPQVVVGVLLAALVITLWGVFVVFAKLAILLACLAGAVIFVLWLVQKIQAEIDGPKPPENSEKKP